MADFVSVSSGAVVHIENALYRVTSTSLFKPAELIDDMGRKVVGNSTSGEKKLLFTEGIPCKLMEPGGDWKQGKLRFRLEFAADD